MSTPDLEITVLRQRYERLSHKKTEAETNLKNAQRRLKELQEQAKQEHGTSDIKRLQTKLAEMNQENERKTGEYRLHLDEIEAKLNEIESDENVPDTAPEDSEEDYDPFAEE